jgi:hypothetical protein
MISKLYDMNIIIGDIVQLTSFSQANEEAIPNMVVWAKTTNKDNSLKYSCLWFVRGKKWEFQYGFLPDFAIQKNSKANNTTILTHTSTLIKGTLLSLRTFEHEVIRNNKGEIEKVTPYCPPTMIFLDIVELKNKSLRAKCLYYNPVTYKYSETLLPFESLYLV